MTNLCVRTMRICGLYNNNTAAKAEPQYYRRMTSIWLAIRWPSQHIGGSLHSSVTLDLFFFLFPFG